MQIFALALLAALAMQNSLAFVASFRRDRSRTTYTARLSSVDTDMHRPRLALLTFDLDDTLFPINRVIQDANDAMLKAMHRLGYTRATNKKIMRHATVIRKHVKTPITYTSLRMRAIHAELESFVEKSESVDSSVVKHCFDVWLDERHKSAERNLFPGTVEMLESISVQHPYACIGAITNGRGSPIYMTSISHFFDFCVSGEDDDVFPQQKPQRGIYEASLAKYTERHPHPISDSEYIWCHVGDCLVNDIGGSTRCGAYGIWMDSDHEESSTSQLSSHKQPSWSTASNRTIRNRQRLSRSAKDKVSAKITKLSELPNAIDYVLEKVAQHQQSFVN